MSSELASRSLRAELSFQVATRGPTSSRESTTSMIVASAVAKVRRTYSVVIVGATRSRPSTASVGPPVLSRAVTGQSIRRSRSPGRERRDVVQVAPVAGAA